MSRSRYLFINLLRDQLQTEEGRDDLFRNLRVDRNQVPAEVMDAFMLIRQLPRFMQGRGRQHPHHAHHFLRFPRFAGGNPLDLRIRSIFKLLILMYLSNLVMFGRRVSLRWLFYIFRDNFGYREPPEPAESAREESQAEQPAYYEQFSKIVMEAIQAIDLQFTFRRANVHTENAENGILGHLAFTFDGKNGELQPNNNSYGIAFPTFFNEYENLYSNADFILYIESGAALSRLVDEKFADKLKEELDRDVFIVSAHGQPTNIFREDFKHLAKELKVPIYFVCDGDVYGLQMANSFIYGTKASPVPFPFAKEQIALLPSDFSQLPQDSLVSLNDKEADLVKKKIELINSKGEEYIAKHSVELVELMEFNLNQKKASLAAFNFLEYDNITLSDFLLRKIEMLIERGEITKKEMPTVKREEDAMECTSSDGEIFINDSEQPTLDESSREFQMEVDDHEIQVLHKGKRGNCKSKREKTQKAKPHNCTKCPSNFTNKYSLTQHMRKKHPESVIPGPIKCAHCHLAFATNISKNRHVFWRHTKPGLVFKCPYCPLSFLSRSELQSHKNREHRNKPKGPKTSHPFICSSCPLSFLSLSELQSHKKREHRNKPKGPKTSSFICPHCNFSFNLKRTMLTHIAKTHPKIEKKFKCQNCPSSFATNKSLKIHIRRHGGVSFPFVCNICSMEFEKKQALSHHKRIHPEYVPNFMCPHCPRGYLSKDSLAKHIKKKHITMCRHCPGSFEDKKSLTQHLEEEHPEHVPKFECPECHLGYLRKGDLNKHIKKKHIRLCHHCQVSFGDKKSLAQHLKDEHPGPLAKFMCPGCSVGYSSKTGLKYHIKKKHSTMCHHCNESFGDKKSLSQHLKNEGHPEQVDQNSW